MGRCVWTIDDWGGDSQWQTECGKAFEFEDGGPLSNGFKFCGYCGMPLVEEYTSELRQKQRGEDGDARP